MSRIITHAGALACLHAAARLERLNLQFILAHPAVTVVVPATADPAHASENFAAGAGPLPDAAQRQRIVAELQG